MRTLSLLLLACLHVPALAQDPPPADDAPPIPTSSRMEFDERLIQGERASGAVYLFQRRPRELPGLVPMRRSFRSRIVEPVLGERPMKPPGDLDVEVAPDEEAE